MANSSDRPVALVTGASRGIGRAIAVALAREGYTLALWARTAGDLEATQAICASHDAEAHVFRCDLAREGDINRAFKRTLKTAGEVDLLVNNAGIGVRKVVEKIRTKDWDRLMAVNLRAPYLLMKLALPRMKKRKRGQIINVASGAGRNGIAEMSAYCASKFGLIGLTESAGLEVRQYGVKVQTVSPGSTDTHFMGRRPGKSPGRLRAEDVADLVLFLVRQDPQAWTSEANLRPLVLKR